MACERVMMDKSGVVPGKAACGILFSFNEEHILRYTLKHYLEQGIDIVVFDNESTDLSPQIIEALRRENGLNGGRIIDVVSVKTRGYEWRDILKRACEYMHKNLSAYEWIMLIDADSLYHSPVKGMSLLEFMRFNKRCGYNIINGKVFEFYPTEKDDSSVFSPLERIKHYKIDGRYRQHKIFLYHPSVDFFGDVGHSCRRDGPLVSAFKFLYFHYPWVSYEQGCRKVFEERIPRYSERSIDPMLHVQYLGMLPREEDFIKRSDELRLFRKEEVEISLRHLALAAHFRTFLALCRHLKEIFLGSKFYAKLRRFPDLFFYDKALSLRYLAGHVKWVIRGRLSPSSAGTSASSAGPFYIAPFSEVVGQGPVAIGLPQYYHFLLTNFCNARCIFCNQGFADQPRRELSLEKFKAIISHIPMGLKHSFFLSGGGEPMLCRNFFAITRHLNENFPQVRVFVRTNGTLLKDHAEELASCGIDKLEISLHAASARLNRSLMSGSPASDIFEDIAVLNGYLSSRNSKMRKSFCAAVSQLNIEEVPGIIEKAHGLGVEEVSVAFCRYYSGRPPEFKDSLFFNKNKYNEVMLKSKRLAKTLKVSFNHEPLFFTNFKQRPCFQPWQNIVIDWDGEIYPCTGGEVMFKRNGRQDSMSFGNLLDQELIKCWNSTPYVMIRRTCNRKLGEDLIRECGNCHNSICLHGPDSERGHLIRMPSG